MRSDLPLLIDSLRRQTDRAFDFVIVDGGSTDGTWDIVETSGDIITRALRGTDHGLYDALNKGIRAAQTEFYVVAGADDSFEPDAIACYKRVARETSADIVIASVLAGNELRTGFHRNRAWRGHAAMITSHSVGMLVRKSLHTRFGYYSPRYSVLADGYFIKRSCTDASVNVQASDFLAGRFGVTGASNRDLVRVLCESWQIQIDTGENPLIQYLLFQLRLIRNLPQILRGSSDDNP